MGEDEFYDAVENALDKLEEEQEYRDKLKLMSNAMSHQPETISEATQHQLWSTINTVWHILKVSMIVPLKTRGLWIIKGDSRIG